ncbi:MAG: hypothetical protein A2Y77_15130 [Planctomycetes bacterium RBG_13_62_9]|nr:MAG: hypothetical protein A2Y77_15130 [Planctomycetes bacterium RBG_13_62_9]
MTTERQGEHRPFEYEEIWLAKSDGSQAPRFLARGGWPNWAADSRRVYYHSRAENKMYCIPIDAKGDERREVLECMDMFPTISPDEKYVATMTTDATLQIVDLSSRAAVPGWPGPADKQQLFLNWSPDGSKLSVGCYFGGGLWLYDFQKREASKILDGSFAWCSWSGPDRSRMAVEKVYSQWHHEIWLIQSDPGTPTTPEKRIIQDQ